MKDVALFVLLVFGLMMIGAAGMAVAIGPERGHWCRGFCDAKGSVSSFVKNGDCYCRTGDDIFVANPRKEDR